ncbi:MAG: response regulator, partial [Bacteroidota bacterium]
MTGGKLDLLIKLNELTEYARRGDEFLPDELCNFLANEFDLSAVVLFTVDENNSLNVLGRSINARKTYRKGAAFNCSICKSLSQNYTSTLELDSNCEIQISDFLIYEGCSFLNISETNKMMVKVGRKSPFTQNDKDTIEKALQLSAAILLLWIDSKNNGLASSIFSKIVAETTNELKAGSNSIIGHTTILAKENLTPTQTEFISAIKKNAQSILLSINDLNELSKIELNLAVRNIKQISISRFVNEIVEMFRSRLGNRKINFSISIDKEFEQPIGLDDQKLRYILSSLLFVSTTLTAQGEIALKVTLTEDNKVRFMISDTGKILPLEVVEKIFDPFTLSKLDDFKNSPLTGLSLTLVKKYVNHLDGEITASSSAGKGNLFTFTISGEVMSALENSISQLPKPTTKNKVLVIEDDYATSKLLSNYLNKWGYDPTIVSTEEQAFAVIDNEQLLAIILDIELPNVNGLELLKKIHEHHNTKNVPVIVCSVEPEQQKAFMMGAVEYFIKPINYNYLVEVLTNYKLRKNSNILCVDDDLPTLNLVQQAIESAGFIAVAENISANVMNLIKNKDIDLAIIDLDMPAPNGFELIKLIKSDKKFTHLPIIIYTGKENYREDLYKIEGLFEEL